MVLLKKTTAVRGAGGGNKFICDLCSVDITSTVRVHCAQCPDYDLCVPCFAEGEPHRDHDPGKHEYHVIEQHSIPIYQPDWGADEEMLLLEGAEIYGLGSWADIADHIGGYRTRDEVRDHYIKTYIDSPNFPLPARASPTDQELLEQIPREEFQARKKRRIEERKEAAKNAPPATPKQKPTASVPSCHEVQGYMPGRLEFETEYFNEAEEAVQHMTFEPGDGINPRTNEVEPEMELKMTVMDIYNSKLTARVDRKKIIFEHKLLEYRKNVAQEKKKTKEEKELFNKTKPFARLMQHEDYEEFAKGLEYEHNLRQAIDVLQEWRRNQISTLKAGSQYENEKTQRISRGVVANPYDRLATNRIGKPTPPVEVTSQTTALTAPDLPIRLQNGLHTPPPSQSPDTNGVNGQSNGITVQSAKPKFNIQPLPNTNPLKFNPENAADLHLLSTEEQDVCSILRIQPKPYMAIKANVLQEAIKQGGSLKRKTVKEMCKIDVNKGSRLFDFFVFNGWIAKA